MAETTTIVRIERNGVGFFRHQDSEIYGNPIFMNIRDKHFDLPTPYLDIPDQGWVSAYDGLWYCAYKSLEQVRDWLTDGQLQYLIELGFRILHLEVEEFRVGNHQVVYLKNSIVSETDITKIFTNKKQNEVKSEKL